jgi:uncharacterized membrane protein
MRLFGHPVHPPLVHFPLALLTLAPVFDGLGWCTGQAFWWTIGFWNLAAGLVFALMTAVAGFIDAAAVSSDDPAAKRLSQHLSVMLTAVSCSGGALAVRQNSAPPAGTALWFTLGLEGAGALLLLGGGWLGGELVYRHGVGVRRRKD